jgi:N-6 DNA Methylase
MVRPRTGRNSALAFDAITVEGALISPAMLGRIARHEADGQSGADYAVPKGLTLRDEIARYFRIGQALRAEFTASQNPSLNATITFVEKLLHDVLGFGDLRRVGTRTLADRKFAVTLEGLQGRAPIVVVPPADDLDRPSTSLAVDAGRRSATSALQDWLNASGDATWGICCNGCALRLVRANASLTRPAYIEADLQRIFEDEAFADFAALWLLINASRFGHAGAPPSDSALERWRDAGQKEGVAARDRLRDGVEAALLSLGKGFLSHSDNAALRERLRTGELSLPEFFGQLLRLVYRLIFQLAAEDRNLLHPPSASAAARRLYAEGYSVGTLRDRAVRRAAWDRHHDRWEGLLITFAALGQGERRLGLPALDGLFAPGTLPDLERAKLGNRHLMEAIYRLAWLKGDSGLMPVNWRDMETEELGSVYESLLELTPRLTDEGRGFIFAEGGEAHGHARKTSGSYYTPDSLVQALLESALDPVLDRVEVEADDPAAALLSVTVLDPACGSGHFLLAAARRIATRLARARAGGVASPADYRRALRDVVRACIHGVDRNPMAVELTKVALWIETVEPGKPLGFLDANIRCGDSLLGVFDLKALEQGVPDLAYKPLSGDDKETAKYFEKRNKAEREGQGSLDFIAGAGQLPAAAPLVGEARALRAMPEDSTDQITAKRQRFEAALSYPHRRSLRIAADLYMAAFLAPKAGGVPANRNTVTIPTSAHVWEALAGHTMYGPLVERAQEFSGAARTFHWPLEFPDIMASGGFDVLLGNPPWEKIKLQEKEFFSSRDPDVASAPHAAARQARIRALAAAPEGSRERNLFDEFETAKRVTEAASVFVRLGENDGGRFTRSGRGDVNTYALFSELFSALNRESGRAGFIVPAGLATDLNTSLFFSYLVEAERLIQIIGFENEEFIFPEVHNATKFAIFVIGHDGSGRGGADYVFFLRNVDALSDLRRHFTLSAKDISVINPNTKTAPVFRSKADAELALNIHRRIPVLFSSRPDGNPWGIEFLSMFHMSNDSHLFIDLAEMGSGASGPDLTCARGLRRGDFVALYEGKMFHQFNHRHGTYGGYQFTVGKQVKEVPPPTAEQMADPHYEVDARYWVKAEDQRARLAESGWDRRWMIGYRSITGATVYRTMIAAILPDVAVGNSTPIVLIGNAEEAALLLGAFNSIAFDYLIRLKLGGNNLNYNYLRQVPVPPPRTFDQRSRKAIVSRVLQLSYTSDSLSAFAKDLGYVGPPSKWDEVQRAELCAQLDAWYARAYGLTRDELRYVLDPADVKGPDYPSETFRVLKKNEIARFGEYRTARLVLAAYDQLTKRPLAAE